jgi:acetate kinase
MRTALDSKTALLTFIARTGLIAVKDGTSIDTSMRLTTTGRIVL